MKPVFEPLAKRQHFLLTDYSFQSGLDEWRGYSWSGGDDDSDVRKFHNLRREFLLESARERTREMVAFAIVALVAFWPVIYMVVTVVKLLLKGRPLDE